MNYIVKTLGMYEFGLWEEATPKAGKAPTTTKWADCLKRDNNDREFVRCRLVARDFKPWREGPRDDVFAAMPPLESKKALFACVARVRKKWREQGLDEVQPMFLDVKKTHFNAKCEEGERVELPKEFKKFGKYAKLKVESTILHLPTSQVRVVVHGDDAATETALKKIRSKCLSDMTSRCLASSAARTVTYEKWSETDERMEYQATDRHRQTLMEGLGFCEGSKNGQQPSGQV